MGRVDGCECCPAVRPMLTCCRPQPFQGPNVVSWLWTLTERSDARQRRQSSPCSPVVAAVHLDSFTSRLTRRGLAHGYREVTAGTVRPVFLHAKHATRCSGSCKRTKWSRQTKRRLVFSTGSQTQRRMTGFSSFSDRTAHCRFDSGRHGVWPVTLESRVAARVKTRTARRRRQGDG
jgi:hypothetical protein